MRALALLHLCAGPAVHSPSSGPVRIGPGAEGVAPLVLTVVASPLDLAIAFAPALRLGEHVDSCRRCDHEVYDAQAPRSSTQGPDEVRTTEEPEAVVFPPPVAVG